MKGFKAFEKGLICRGKQYRENTVFEEPEAKICERGMHFCSDPFDVLEHYDLVNPDGTFNEFAEVESLAEVYTDDNKKYCTTKLKIGAKLSFSGYIKACVNFAIKNTKGSGDYAKIGSTGDAATIGSSGDYAKIGSSGDAATIGSSGDCAKVGSSGNAATIGSSGDYATIGSTGDYAKIGSTGNAAKIGSSGDAAKVGSSGNYATIGSTGNCAKIGSSGDAAKVGSSGNSAKIGSSGDYAKIGSTGNGCVICCAGHGAIVKAKKGSWITLAEWKYDKDKKCHVPTCVKTEFVDGVRIKSDVYYRLEAGVFVENETA